MPRNSDVGLLVYSTRYDHAMDNLNALFSDHNDHEFRVLPETALGTGVSFPDGLGLISRTIFPYTAAIAVSPVEVSAEEMEKTRTEAMRERFW